VNSAHKRRQPRSDGSQRESGQRCRAQSNAGGGDQTRPFEVWIEAFGRRRLWSRYSNRVRAEQEVSGLRRHGFDAVIEAAS